MPSLRASPTAMCSLLVSTTQTADGTFAMSRIPPRLRSSLFFSRVSIKISFLGPAPDPAGLLHRLELLEALQAFVHRGEVGEHATQPALVHVRHADAGRLGCDRRLRLL